MHFTPLVLTALSCLSLVVEAAPFEVKHGQLQRSRRRAVDYPVIVNDNHRSPKVHRKRSLNYSVVQVDGSSPTPNPPSPQPPQTVIHTVTQPAVTSTETLLYTTVIEDSEAPKTIVLTSTKIHTIEVQPTKQPEPANVVVVSAQPVVMAAPVKTVIKTIVDPSPTTTRYYDDGMWHTYYPMKTWFVPPTATPTPSPEAGDDKIYRRGSPKPVVVKPKQKRALSSSNVEEADHSIPSQPRTGKVIADLRQVDWNVTRTELDGLRKFMS